MAQKKFDKAKHQPSRADIETLATTLRKYVETCEESARLMGENGPERLEVPNWNSAIKALRHVDNLVRSIAAAAAFGTANPMINKLLATQPEGSREAGEAESPKSTTRGRKKPPS